MRLIKKPVLLDASQEKTFERLLVLPVAVSPVICVLKGVTQDYTEKCSMRKRTRYFKTYFKTEN